MPSSPIERTIGFWKPSADPEWLRDLAVIVGAGEAPVRGVNAVRAAGSAQPYRVVEGDMVFSLFAAVHPIPDVPDAAEPIAEILDWSGEHYSYVLWFAQRGAVVVPFDPDDAVEALLWERYIPPARRTVLPQPLLSAYYAAKPLIPPQVRKRLRERMANRAQNADTFLEWPADQSLDQLRKLLMRVLLLASDRDEIAFDWFWPDGHPWAAVLTHDVETADGLANVVHVMEVERERGLRSSFNLVPMDYEVPGWLLEDARNWGFEIGVHGYTHDGLLFSKWSTFLERVVTINECGRRWESAGFRSPATYRNQDWFHLLEFEYDSSVTDTAPFEPQPGGCGSLFPYMVEGIVELQMTLPQDHTLFGLLRQDDASVWLSKLSHIREAHGMACVLTHPDPAPGYIGVEANESRYREVLGVIAESDAWTPLPRDLARWWRQRAQADGSLGEDGSRRTRGTARLEADGSLAIVPPGV